MDPTQSESLMTLPAFEEQDLLRYDTSGLIDSAATLSCVNEKSLN